MHYSAFLYAVTTALCATSVSSRCFQSGDNWGDHGKAKAELAEACKELKGNYNAGQPWSVCRNNGGHSLVFEVKNTARYGRTYAEDVCRANIGREIDNCGHGGEETIDGWQFRYVRRQDMSLLVLTYIGAILTMGTARPANLLGRVGRFCR